MAVHNSNCSPFNYRIVREHIKSLRITRTTGLGTQHNPEDSGVKRRNYSIAFPNTWNASRFGPERGGKSVQHKH